MRIHQIPSIFGMLHGKRALDVPLDADQLSAWISRPVLAKTAETPRLLLKNARRDEDWRGNPRARENENHNKILGFPGSRAIIPTVFGSYEPCGATERPFFDFAQ